MARKAGESSTKRAKVDEKEDPLVRRKEEVVRLLERARKGKDNARAMEELLTLCTRLEAKNEKLLRRLPPELWQKIVDEYLDQNDLFPLAMTCRLFRDTTKDLGKEMKTDLNIQRLLYLWESGKVTSYTLGWFQWVCDTLQIQAVFEEWSVERVKKFKGDLLNYGALPGSVEILRLLMEEEGCEPNDVTDWWVGFGGSVEVLEYFLERGYEFDEAVCGGAAEGGRLEVLKFLRGLDPPCPWDIMVCSYAAKRGHLEVLQWARDQDPPCPWTERTCEEAAEEGHLEILKWLRDQDPPCPWGWMTCYGPASHGDLEILKWARSQDPPCPWDEATCGWAVLKGQLEALKWLRAQNPPCPWNRDECRKSASNKGYQHIVDWIDKQEN
ncbi:putative ankyrin repeat protein [Chloropicon roscoffensis]|uniref:Ankyrin repeat protein n=1 Tax=Chloropicon roscoffensis TaxID=1461544 RepID=A0AAX4NYI8_9CHLO